VANTPSHRAQLARRQERAPAWRRKQLERKTLQWYATETGISLRTANNDRDFFMAKADEGVIDLAARTREEYRAEEMERYAALEVRLADPQIKPDRKIELALSIIRGRKDLLGLDEPSRSVSAHVNVDADIVDPSTLPEYRRWLHETRFMDSATKEKMFQLIAQSGLNVRIHKTVEVPTSSPLWDQPKLQVPKGPEDSDDAD
jgi:hypothetical protein